MTPEPTPLVTVLPCDRQCAADTLSGLVSGLTIEHILLGRYDTDDMVQSPARHRLAALEAAAKVADERAEMRRRLYEETPVSINAAKAVEAEEIATAIRALSNKIGEGTGDEKGDLLKRAREYVADALDAHEHSDGRDLLNEIDAALASEEIPA